MKRKISPLKKTEHKHDWYYSDTVKFGNEEEEFKFHYRIIHHCRTCGQLDIQTIYQ